jgi:hypothetical protein
MDFYSTKVLPFRPMSHVTALSEAEQLPYKPGVPDSEKDQMTLKWTVGDRRALEKKAAAANQSPTKWLQTAVNATPARLTKRDKAEAPVEGEISFVLDATRQDAAELLAKKLRFHEVEHLAKDLLFRAIEDPEMAEEFLFGKLRARLQSDSTNQKKAA